MNAGRDVERLIAGWLVEEAAPGAPDRVLESTRQVVRRTNQRRFAALWREPMLTPARVAAMAAVLALAVGSGFLIGRATSPSGPAAPAATPTASPTTSPGASLAEYRAARNAICGTYRPLVQEQNALLDKLYDPGLSPADRQPKVTALQKIATLSEQTVNELDRMDVPAELIGEHEAQLAYYRSTIALIRDEIAALGAGDLSAAEALDLATDPNSRAIEAFESKHGLAACP